MNQQPRHIEPEVIANLIATGIKVHSSSKGRTGDVKYVDLKSKYVHMRSGTGEQFVTRFDTGTSVELTTKKDDAKMMIIRDIIHTAPQADLFNPEETKRDQEFNEFHDANPKVYAALVDMTRQMHERGHKRIGMSMLYEVLRWRTMLNTTGDDFKLNNNYQSRYARKIMAEYPEFENMFETRELKS